MDNKFPGKDISDSDLKDKFPLAAKNLQIIIQNLEFAELNLEEKIPVMAGPNMVENLPMIRKTAFQ